MQADALARTSALLGGDGDVDRAVDRPQQLPKRRRGNMAQDRPLTTSEYRCHPAAVEIGCEVTHGVDPLMDAVQPTLLRSLSGRLSTQPKRFELSQRDDPMLTSRNISEPRIHRVAFVAHKETKATAATSLPLPSRFFVPQRGFGGSELA